jgi:peptidyl-prolyl cis-trans isomerase SurA
MMVRQFEEVAFSLRPGVVSPVTRTEFGYHIIIVDRVQPGEVKARHILFAPVVTAAEGTVAHARADTVAMLLRRGANLDSLVRLYGDSSEPRAIPATNRDSLPGGYSQALASADSGQIVGPAALTPDAPDRTRWLVAVVTTAAPSHVATYEELRERIRSQLIEQKGMKNLFIDLRRQIYVDMRL